MLEAWQLDCLDLASWCKLGVECGCQASVGVVEEA
jgi:hypothetical protein